MDLVEAIKARRSVRAYLPQSVPKETLEQILELASHAPSWANTQPWEVAIIGGDVMKRLQDAMFQMASSGTEASPDISFPQFPDRYRMRSRSVGASLYELLGINRDDREARLNWSRRGNRFLDAPNGLVFYIDRDLGSYSILDLGFFCQSVMLLAASFGLGTCVLAQSVPYPSVLRQILGIPEDKQIVIGMSIGYPDWQHPANKFVSQREPVDSFARWCGL